MIVSHWTVLNALLWYPARGWSPMLDSTFGFAYLEHPSKFHPRYVAFKVKNIVNLRVWCAFWRGREYFETYPYLFLWNLRFSELFPKYCKNCPRMTSGGHSWGFVFMGLAVWDIFKMCSHMDDWQIIENSVSKVCQMESTHSYFQLAMAYMHLLSLYLHSVC